MAVPAANSVRQIKQSLIDRVLAQMLGDVLAILIAFGLVSAPEILFQINTTLLSSSALTTMNLAFAAYLLAWFTATFLWTAHRSGLYSFEAASTWVREMLIVLQSNIVAGLMMSGAILILARISISSRITVSLMLVTAIALCTERTAIRVLRTRDRAKYATQKNVAIIGTNQLCVALSEHLTRNPRLGFNFVGFIRFPNCKFVPSVNPDMVIGSIEEVPQLKEWHFIDELVIAEFCPDASAMNLVAEAQGLGIEVSAISGFYAEFTAKSPIEYMGNFPIVSLHRCKTQLVARFFKGLLDRISSLGALAFLAIPILMIAVAIKLDSRGPVFYPSQRVGKRGRLFICYKFRTMIQGAEAQKKELAALNERDGVLFKVTNDPRITKLGKFLRKYSLDELPQLLNVLKGDMSMVGPRPPIAAEVEQYKLEQLRRLDAKPGLTGLWQVKARQDNSFAKYVALDLAYLENWSLWMDLKILFLTVGVVLRGTGA